MTTFHHNCGLKGLFLCLHPAEPYYSGSISAHKVLAGLLAFTDINKPVATNSLAALPFQLIHRYPPTNNSQAQGINNHLVDPLIKFFFFTELKKLAVNGWMIVFIWISICLTRGPSNIWKNWNPFVYQFPKSPVTVYSPSIMQLKKQVCHLHGNYSTNKIERVCSGHGNWIHRSSCFCEEVKISHQDQIWVFSVKGDNRVCIHFQHDIFAGRVLF